jgi:hypothetical protein
VNNSATPSVAARNPGGVRFPFATFDCDERQSPTSEISGLTVHGDLVLCLQGFSLMIGSVERWVSHALRTNNDDRFTARKIFYKLITERLDKG